MDKVTLRDLFAMVALHAYLQDKVDACLFDIVTDAFVTADVALKIREDRDYTVGGGE